MSDNAVGMNDSVTDSELITSAVGLGGGSLAEGGGFPRYFSVHQVEREDPVLAVYHATQKLDQKIQQELEASITIQTTGLDKVSRIIEIIKDATLDPKCKKKCFQKLSETDRNDLVWKFNDMGDKIVQSKEDGTTQVAIMELFLRGMLESHVYATRPRTIQELKGRIGVEAEAIQQETFHKAMSKFEKRLGIQ
uniref:Uncharacterized protein n=1 Tax=Timema monikensis TaxID=170555 RepID=A0A7R9HTI8_9NEOP|nr:unnamed protein product [Timema monikensis]